MRKSLTQTVSLVLTVLDTFCIAVMALLFIILFFTSPPCGDVFSALSPMFETPPRINSLHLSTALVP